MRPVGCGPASPTRGGGQPRLDLALGPVSIFPQCNLGVSLTHTSNCNDRKPYPEPHVSKVGYLPCKVSPAPTVASSALSRIHILALRVSLVLALLLKGHT